MQQQRKPAFGRLFLILTSCLFVFAGAIAAMVYPPGTPTASTTEATPSAPTPRTDATPTAPTPRATTAGARPIAYAPREPMDTGGFAIVSKNVPAWLPQASLEEISQLWRGAGYRTVEQIDRYVAREGVLA